MTSSELRIRPYERGDEHALADLFERCFGFRRELDYWRWKLISEVPPFENVWFAEAGGEVIGHYGAMPVRVQLGERRGWLAVIVDVMVAPSSRRRGVLSSLIAAVHRAWGAQGVLLVIGLPNQQWGSRTRVFNLPRLFTLQWLTLRLRPAGHLAARINAFSQLAAPLDALRYRYFFANRTRRDVTLMEHEPSIKQRDPLDEIGALAMQAHRFSILRDASWIQQRYVSCPAQKYRVLLASADAANLGYCVYAIREVDRIRSAVFAETITRFEKESAVSEMVRAVVGRMYHEGVHYVRALAIPGTSRYEAYRNLGFVPRENFNVHAGLLQTGTVSLEALSTPEGWLMTGGEFDVV